MLAKFAKKKSTCLGCRAVLSGQGISLSQSFLIVKPRPSPSPSRCSRVSQLQTQGVRAVSEGGGLLGLSGGEVLSTLDPVSALSRQFP